MQRDPEGGQELIGLEVQIVDTGVGIVAENVDAILTAFTQENSSISRKFGGTGLGLSIESTPPYDGKSA